MGEEVVQDILLLEAEEVARGLPEELTADGVEVCLHARFGCPVVFVWPAHDLADGVNELLHDLQEIVLFDHRKGEGWG